MKGVKKEVEVPCKEHIRIFVKNLMDEEEDDDLASVSGLVEEEEQLEKEIEELQQKLCPAKVYWQKKGVCVWCGMKHIQSLKLRIKLDRWSGSMFL